MEKDKFSGSFSSNLESVIAPLGTFTNSESNFFLNWRARKKISLDGYESAMFNPLKLLVPKDNFLYPESLWYLAEKVSDSRRHKVYFSKCSNRTLTAAG